MCSSAKLNSRCFWCLEADGWRISTASLQGTGWLSHFTSRGGLPPEPEPPRETLGIRFSRDIKCHRIFCWCNQFCCPCVSVFLGNPFPSPRPRGWLSLSQDRCLGVFLRAMRSLEKYNAPGSTTYSSAKHRITGIENPLAFRATG